MEVPGEVDSVYAQLGFALYQAQALEHALASLYADSIRKKDSFWSIKLQQIMSERQLSRFHRMAEELVQDLELAPEFVTRLARALDDRSWLLNQFYFDLGRSAYDEATANQAAGRLQEVAEELQALTLDLNEYLFSRQLTQDPQDRTAIEQSIRLYWQQAKVF